MAMGQTDLDVPNAESDVLQCNRPTAQSAYSLMWPAMVDTLETVWSVTESSVVHETLLQITTA